MVAGRSEEGKALILNYQVCRSAHCSHLMLRSQTLECRRMLCIFQSLKSCCPPLILMYTTYVGLPLVNHYVFDVYVQISPITSPEMRILHINQLQLDLAGDLDLALVPPGLTAWVVQTLFICSGCDFVSFFVGFAPGNATIMRHFFENAWFVTGTQDILLH